MNAGFHIGDIAVIVKAAPMFSRYLNTDCEIIGYGPGGPCEYEIRCCDGFVVFGDRTCLRKRRRPLDPAFVKFRDQLVREFAMDPTRQIRMPHPAITSLLDLVGQSPIESACKALDR